MCILHVHTYVQSVVYNHNPHQLHLCTVVYCCVYRLFFFAFTSFGLMQTETNVQLEGYQGALVFSE